MSYRALIPLLALAVASCMNPVHSDAVAALGDEAAGVREGPTHRPGQPCLTCHGGYGPGPDFEMAGTVYDAEGSTLPAVNATVMLTDATGKAQVLTTNSVGNFYIEAARYTPTYPLRVKIAGGGATQEMVTRIGRRTGCGDCHRAGGSQSLAPAIFLRSP